MSLVLSAPDGIGEITRGTDLGALASQTCSLLDGDILLVTSKAVSKAEGRVRPGDRKAHLGAESSRILATRGETSIVANRSGMVQAAAGIDASNVAPGHVVLLPVDADASARRIRATLADAGANVAVIITDTFGRAWRNGQTDLALGVAGMVPLDDHAGREDAYGNALAVTAMALVDELAGAGDLVKGKLGGRPLAVARGRAELVLPLGEDGPGTAPLVRPLGQDMFALGTREAVLAALVGDQPEAFGAPAPASEVAAFLLRLGVSTQVLGSDLITDSAMDAATASRVRIAAHAFGWALDASGSRVRLRPQPPAP